MYILTNGEIYIVKNKQTKKNPFLYPQLLHGSEIRTMSPIDDFYDDRHNFRDELLV